MIVYWTIYLITTIPGFSPRKISRNLSRIISFLFAVILFVIIGMRDRIGCDWMTYLGIFENMDYKTFSESLTTTDPGYGFLNWLYFHLGLSIYALNMTTAAIFVIGLTAFCWKQPITWLAYVVAIPYFVIVVSMGYSRQATALGFIMLALNYLVDRSTLRFMICVLLATLFHKTAFIFAFFSIVPIFRRSIRLATVATGFAIVITYILFVDSADGLIYGYVEQEYASAGGIYRIIICTFSAFILIVYRKRWILIYEDFNIYFLQAISAIIALPMSIISPVGADRMALYLLPFQVATFSRIPYLIGVPKLYYLTSLCICSFYALLLFVWLNYADNVYCWVPYKSVLF